jgi:hypothetical protein
MQETAIPSELASFADHREKMKEELFFNRGKPWHHWMTRMQRGVILNTPITRIITNK